MVDFQLQLRADVEEKCLFYAAHPAQKNTGGGDVLEHQFRRACLDRPG